MEFRMMECYKWSRRKNLDYAWASLNSDCTSDISKCNTDNVKNNNCFFNGGLWLLLPISKYEHISYVVYSTGKVAAGDLCYDAIAVHSSLYLKSEVMFTFGDGTSSNPYRLSLQL